MLAGPCPNSNAVIFARRTDIVAVAGRLRVDRRVQRDTISLAFENDRTKAMRADRVRGLEHFATPGFHATHRMIGSMSRPKLSVLNS
jgi:hypothetical protein